MLPVYLLIAVFGLTVGSFLNVCIWRIPRGQSVVHPPSACPTCGMMIKPWDNIPVLSYMILGGMCRACRSSISMRYPLIESLNAALYVLVFWRMDMGWHLLPLFAFTSALVVITFIDIDHQIIPDRITYAGVVLGLIAGATILPDPFERYMVLGWQASLIGAVSGFAVYYAILKLSRGGMGGGDVKMMAMVGAVLGWKGVFLTTFIASSTGAAYGLMVMARSGGGRKTRVPFGPFLSLGCLITMLYGQEILDWYLSAGY